MNLLILNIAEKKQLFKLLTDTETNLRNIDKFIVNNLLEIIIK